MLNPVQSGRSSELSMKDSFKSQYTKSSLFADICRVEWHSSSNSRSEHCSNTSMDFFFPIEYGINSQHGSSKLFLLVFANGGIVIISSFKALCPAIPLVMSVNYLESSRKSSLSQISVVCLFGRISLGTTVELCRFNSARGKSCVMPQCG